MVLKKKMKRLMGTGVLMGILTFSSLNNVSAETTIHPTYVPYDGYEYVHSTHSRGLTIYWQHTHTNNKPTTDTVSYSVSRQAYANANVSVSSTFNAMVEQVGVSAEVSWGTSVTKTTTISWTIPAYSTYTLRYGSRWVKAYGKENYYSRGTLVSSKSVSGQWTYEGYSDSIKQ